MTALRSNGAPRASEETRGGADRGGGGEAGSRHAAASERTAARRTRRAEVEELKALRGVGAVRQGPTMARGAVCPLVAAVEQAGKPGSWRQVRGPRGARALTGDGLDGSAV